MRVNNVNTDTPDTNCCNRIFGKLELKHLKLHEYIILNHNDKES